MPPAESSFPCPACKGPIRSVHVDEPGAYLIPINLELDGTVLGVGNFGFNRMDMWRHAGCFGGPDGGEPVPVPTPLAA